MSLSGKARLAGVVGWPVGHSLSPRLHAYWLKHYGIDGAYVPLPVRREDLAMVLGGLHRAGFAGVNVTIPHKEAAFALSQRLDDAAQAAGAVNLLLFRDGVWEGRNTDAAGLAASLRAAHINLAGGRATLLGAGGAARASLLALDMLGAGEIHITNRNAGRAAQLCALMAPYIKAKLHVAENFEQAAAHSALLVNATSLGMQGQPDLNLSLEALPNSAAICDLVYTPLETSLLRQGRARGHQVVDGLGMLLHQAAPSFAAFYGVEPEVTPELRQWLLEVLQV